MTKRYDKTQTTRQRRRRAALDEVARRLGYQSWARLETAVINGAVTVTVQAAETHEAEAQS